MSAITNTCPAEWAVGVGVVPVVVAVVSVPVVAAVVSVLVEVAGLAAVAPVVAGLAGAGYVAGAAVGEAGAGVVAGAGVAVACAGTVWTATRWRRATSDAYEGVRRPVLVSTITAVDSADATATSAMCGQVNRIDRSRLDITR